MNEASEGLPLTPDEMMRGFIHSPGGGLWFTQDDVEQIICDRQADTLEAAADEIGPFQGAVLAGPIGDAFCQGWDAALNAVRERARTLRGER